MRGFLFGIIFNAIMNEDIKTTSIPTDFISSRNANRGILKLEKLEINKIISLFSRAFRASLQAVKNKINDAVGVGTSGGNFGKNRNSRLFIIFIAVVLLGLSFYLGKSLNQNSTNYNDDRPLPSATKARQDLNKEFKFPLKDARGEDLSEIKYVIESAELQDSIIVKGQRARAVKGRTFLILNIKISNNFTQGIEINSRDYVRLLVNDSKELIAADVHNDPVAVQAISTKYTRLGFPINDSDKNLMLKIGEIKGSKQTIQLNF